MAEMNWIELALITAGFTFLIMLSATTGVVVMLKILDKINII